MEKHVTDLETSKRLAEVGVNNISKWYHCIPFNGMSFDKLCLRQCVGVYYCPDSRKTYNDTDFDETYHAYLLDELLEMVEDSYSLLYSAFLNEHCVHAFGKSPRKGKILHGCDPIQAVAEAIIWQRSKDEK